MARALAYDLARESYRFDRADSDATGTNVSGNGPRATP
jgi:hypothetical protein